MLSGNLARQPAGTEAGCQCMSIQADNRASLLLSSHSEGAMDGDACPSPHDNAIQQRNVGLGVLRYQVVHGVLMGEEPAHASTTMQAASGQRERSMVEHTCTKMHAEQPACCGVLTGSCSVVTSLVSIE